MGSSKLSIKTANNFIRQFRAVASCRFEGCVVCACVPKMRRRIILKYIAICDGDF